ncbi:MAG: ATP-binding region ATPase domain protein [Gemmatimonadetes bacterium]|nr:ATP-binding region ATPase domain protein [Gemmatimonadota bacterium]
MPTPPPRERSGGADERLPARRPADTPAPSGEALVEHLVDRLAASERELRAARDDIATANARQALLSEAARRLITHPGTPAADLARLALPVLGDWCLVEELAGDHAERTLVAREPSVERAGGALTGWTPIDRGAVVGLGRVLRGGRIERLESLPRRHAAGGVVDVSAQAALLALARGPVLVVPVNAAGGLCAALTFGRPASAAAYDETDQRIAADVAGFVALALQQRREAAAADAAMRAKAEFLAMMSHELRTPLNAIAGYAQLLEMGFRGPLNEGQRDAVSRIIRGQEHLLELVDAVLTFSRLTSGRLVLDDGEVLASTLVEIASAPLAASFADEGIEFRVQGCAEQVRVRADRERAPQILRHLLSNALKFTPRGGVVSVGCEAAAGVVRFVVTDTGRGIPAGQREAIFHPFVQVEKGLTRTADGSGLGLAIGRELAERMGGSLTVTSDVGEGSRFVLTLIRSNTVDGIDSIDSTSGPG